MENIFTITGYREINKVELSSKIFDDELCEYRIENRRDFIEVLIDWISEGTQCKEIMLEDLKYLINLKDEYIFSSINTNEYIAKSDDLIKFNGICKELLKLNDSLKQN